MPKWDAFEVDPAYVHAQIDLGRIDYLEGASHVAESSFFRSLFEQTPWEELVASFPTPRKKEEVPLWLYLSSQLTLRLHGALGYGAYPYIVHCGGLKDVLGERQVQWKEHPESGRWYLQCQGYNDKNDYSRITPCDPDFLRKLARDTDEKKLESWFGRAVPQYTQKVGLWDDEGIVLADGSYLFVPNNEHYENSAVMWFDEHNHPVDRQKLTPAEQTRIRLRRCYRMVNLVHTNRRQEYWTYAGVRMGSGKMAETPVLEPMVRELHAALGKERVKLVIHDRGFIDGPTVRGLKELGIDTLFPLKSDMLDWRDAQRLADADGRPWQIWKPPEPEAQPEPVQRPEHIRARERKRQKTLAAQRAAEPAPVRVDRVQMKMVPEMRLWDTCGVPIQVAVLREYTTDGKMHAWGLATPRKIDDPLEAWRLYQMRNGIEERHRQAKCFWDLTNFRSPDFGLVVNQVVFTLLAYTLMQVFLEKSDRQEIAGKTRRRMWEELLPQGDKISVYADNRVAHLDPAEYSDWLLGVSEGARRRLRGRIRALRRQRRDLPDLPPRP
jgi:hypothetical protein